MKLPLRIKIIIEIAIACGIFVVLVLKTPLFDRSVPEWVRPNVQKPQTSIATGSHIVGADNIRPSQFSNIIRPSQSQTSRPRYTTPSLTPASRQSYIYRFNDTIKPSIIYSDTSSDNGSITSGIGPNSSSRPVNQILSSIARANAQAQQDAIYIQPKPIQDISRLEASDIPPLPMDNTKNI